MFRAAAGCRNPAEKGDKLDDGEVTKTEFAYDSLTYFFHPNPVMPGVVQNFTTSHGNVSEIREYAYGAGAPAGLVRKTTRRYLHEDYPAYTPYNIVDRVLDEKVLDANSVQKARTYYEYDLTALTAARAASRCKLLAELSISRRLK